MSKLFTLVFYSFLLWLIVYSAIEFKYFFMTMFIFMIVLMVTQDKFTKITTMLSGILGIMLMMFIQLNFVPDVEKTEYTIFNMYKYGSTGNNIYLNYDDKKKARTLNTSKFDFDPHYMVINNCKPVVVVETASYEFSYSLTKQRVECGKDIIPFIIANKIPVTVVY